MILNRTASNQPANTISNFFGHLFPQGHIPASSYPAFETHATSLAAPHTYYNRVNWPDGSWKFAGFFLRVPEAVPAARTFTASGGTLTASSITDLATGMPCRTVTTNTLPSGLSPGVTYWIRLTTGSNFTLHTTYAGAIANTGAVTISSSGTGTHTLQPACVMTVKSTSATPVSSSFSNTIFTDKNFKAVASATWNWSGLNTSDLNTGISAGGNDAVVLGDGAAGRLMRVYQEFNNGADNANCGVWHYIAALQNVSTSLYGYRYLCRLQNGWHDAGSSIVTNFMDNLVLLDGATTIKVAAPQVPYLNFNCSAGVFAVSSTSGVDNGVPVYVSATSVLAGLSVGGIYFIRATSATGVTLHRSGNGGLTGGDFVSVSGTGTGKFRTQLFNEWYSGGIWTAETDGRYTFYQGGGTGTEAVADCITNLAYQLSSKVLAPLNRALYPSSNTYRSYYPTQYVDLQWYEDNPGERTDIGWATGWQTKAFIRNDGDTATIRAHSLQYGHKSWGYRRRTTTLPLNALPTSISGMGAVQTGIYLRPSGPYYAGSVNVPLSWSRVFGAQSGAHRPAPTPLVYIMTGEPQYLDLLHDQAIGSLHQGAGSVTAGASTYYPIVMMDGQLRDEVWLLRDMVWAAHLTPNSYCNAELGNYYRQTVANNFDFIRARKLLCTSWGQTNRIHPLNSRNLNNWQLNYLGTIAALAYKIEDDPDAAQVVEDVLYWHNLWMTTRGDRYLTAYGVAVTAGISTMLSVNSLDDLFVGQAIGSYSWNSVSDECSLITSAARTWGTFDNGTPVITPIMGDTLYIANKTATTFQLAELSAGGSIKDLTTNDTQSDASYWAARYTSAVLSIEENVYNRSEGTRCNGLRLWALALGLSVPAYYNSAVGRFFINNSVTDFASDNGYCMVSTF